MFDWIQSVWNSPKVTFDYLVIMYISYLLIFFSAFNQPKYLTYGKPIYQQGGMIYLTCLLMALSMLTFSNVIIIILIRFKVFELVFKEIMLSNKTKILNQMDITDKFLHMTKVHIELGKSTMLSLFWTQTTCIWKYS